MPDWIPTAELGEPVYLGRVQKLALSFAAALGLSTLTAPLHADETGRPPAGARIDRPFTVAQLGVGLLTLPAADVCLLGQACTKGDNSIQVDFWQLYRANRYFAIGAGASVAIKPVTDNPPRTGGIDRTHTRSYFLVEGQARYYALRAETFEAWLGVTAGVVIVTDRYSIEGGETPRAAIIGPRASTIRTEGAATGALLGAEWSFAPNWAVGFTARYMQWFLPVNAATTVFLDRATLTGQQSALNFGISCSYRIAL
jgi:hypothetical protein